ncbi:endoribonuclease Dcr-1 isoform X2 [Pararge aegeria]|uniref:endoribonuclease Dcr-1 isoform X2 n=1 Tax=Pararge aegeria TaxID=116150 RepID=UPI0019D1AA76|nr:endoribonuclease Dcr-1 isoform X2 [Pararge aegeria]
MESSCTRFTAAEGGARLAASASAKNILVTEHTAFISTSVLIEHAYKIRGPLSSGWQRSVYVTRHSHIECVSHELTILTDLAVVKAFNYDDIGDWRQELEDKQVLVCTSEVLQRILCEQIINMQTINVLVIDSCHLIFKDENLQYIMKLYKQCEEVKPRILALTYPLFTAPRDLNEHTDNNTEKVEDTKNINEEIDRVSEEKGTMDENNEEQETKDEIDEGIDVKDDSCDEETDLSVHSTEEVKDPEDKQRDSNGIIKKIDNIKPELSEKLESSHDNDDRGHKETDSEEVNKIIDEVSEHQDVKDSKEDSKDENIDSRNINIDNKDDFHLYEKLEWKIEQLEKELCCDMDLAEDIDGGKRIAATLTKPKELIIEYNHKPETDALPEAYIDLDNFMSSTVNSALDFINEHRYDPTEIYGDELYEEFANIPDPTVEPKAILEQFLYVLDQLGPYAADKAAFSLLIKLEKLKIKVPYERHFLLLCLCTSVFVKIRCYADILFSRYTSDWEKIKSLSTPKVLRLAEILEQFEPPDIFKEMFMKNMFDSARNKNDININRHDISEKDEIKSESAPENITTAADKNIVDCNQSIDKNVIANSNDAASKTNNDSELHEGMKRSKTSELLTAIEKCDFLTLGNKIEDKVNTYEANLKDLDEIDSTFETSTVGQRDKIDSENKSGLNEDNKTDVDKFSVDSKNDSAENTIDSRVSGNNIESANIDNNSVRKDSENNINSVNKVNNSVNKYCGSNKDSDRNASDSNKVGMGKRPGHRVRGRGRLPRSNVLKLQHLQQNPDALCGVVFVKESLIANIMFMIVVDMARSRLSLSHLCAQYCASEGEGRDCQKESKKQEEVLKKFRMHECNLLLATSVLEEGIDLPRCNLVVRWDIPSSYRSHGLCRGRARAPRASVALLAGAEAHREALVHNLAVYKELDQIITRKCGCGVQNEPPQEEEAHADSLAFIVKPYTPKPLPHSDKSSSQRQENALISGGDKNDKGIEISKTDKIQATTTIYNSNKKTDSPTNDDIVDVGESIDEINKGILDKMQGINISNDGGEIDNILSNKTTNSDKENKVSDVKIEVNNSNESSSNSYSNSKPNFISNDNNLTSNEVLNRLTNITREIVNANTLSVLENDVIVTESNKQDITTKDIYHKRNDVNNVCSYNNKNEFEIDNNDYSMQNVKEKKIIDETSNDDIETSVKNLNKHENLQGVYINYKGKADDVEINHEKLDLKSNVTNEKLECRENESECTNEDRKLNKTNAIMHVDGEKDIGDFEKDLNDKNLDFREVFDVLDVEKDSIDKNQNLSNENVLSHKETHVKYQNVKLQYKFSDSKKGDVNAASVDLNSAIALINRYCGKLPSDTFTRLAPQWWMEQVRLPDRDGEMKTAYICTLRMPLNCPVKYNIVGHPMPTRVLARRMVALQACRILHKSGELDNQLMPIGKENFKAAELENNVTCNEPSDPSDCGRPGTTKRRQYYFKRTAWAFTDCQAIIDATDSEIEDNPTPDINVNEGTNKGGNTLYAIASRLWCALPERYNTRGRRLHAPQHAPQAIGVLMARREPTQLQIPAFPVYTRSGEVRVSVEPALQADVRLSPRRARLIRRFMRFVFSDVLRVRRRGMKLHTEGSTHNNYYVVPTIRKTRWDGTYWIDVDWPFLELIYKHTEQKKLEMEKPMVWEQDEKKKEKEKDGSQDASDMENPLLTSGEVFTFDPERYKEAVVTPWYRNQDQPQFFLVAEICWKLSPDSAFPSSQHDSFRSYYRAKYGAELTQSCQPLLDVDHTSARLNLLTPRYVNRKGVALPVSSERTRRAKRDRLDQKQILVPELCRVHPFAAPLWFATVALPCVLYRINALLIADEIRRAVAIEVGLGIPRIDDLTCSGFQWPPLDFGWSLAEVLNADSEKIEKKKDEEESKQDGNDEEGSDKEIQVEIEGVENGEEKEKTINDILQEKFDAESGFEIGTWSNDMASSIPQSEYDELLEPLPSNLTFCTSSSGGTNWSDPVEKPKLFNPTRSYCAYRADSDCSYESSDFDTDDSDLSDCSDDDADNTLFCSGRNYNTVGVRIEYKTTHEAEAVDLERRVPIAPAPQPDKLDDERDLAEFKRILREGVPPVEYLNNFRKSVAKHKKEIENTHLISKDKPIVDLLPEPSRDIDRFINSNNKNKAAYKHQVYLKENVTVCAQQNVETKTIYEDRLKFENNIAETAKINAANQNDSNNKTSSENTRNYKKNDVKENLEISHKHSLKCDGINESLQCLTISNDECNRKLSISTEKCTLMKDTEMLDNTIKTSRMQEKFKDKPQTNPLYNTDDIKNKTQEMFPFKIGVELEEGQITLESIERNKRYLLAELRKSLPDEEIKKMNCFSMKDIDIDSPDYVNEKIANVGFDSSEKYREKANSWSKVNEYKPYYMDGRGQNGKDFDFDYQPNLEGHPGPSPSVILQALTMSNANDGINLERLETIGDSFLKFAITAYLYCAHPAVHEGKLSHMRSKQVSNLNLYRLGRNKRLGARMIASKFEPHDNWLPPCHKPPPTLQPSHTIETKEPVQNPDAPVDSTGCFIPYNLITQHSIPDKSIADCVEALIGAYLLECGPRGALLFMSWLGIRVLPQHLIPLPEDHPYVLRATDKVEERETVQRPPTAKPVEPLSSDSCCSDDEEADQEMSAPEHDWSWPGRPVGALRPYRDNNGRWMQPIYGELKAPPSPLLRYIDDPEGELEQMLSGYDALERTLQYRFRDRSLLLQALTHASHQKNRLTDCYQRLEFLGDAILDYLITRHLYEDPRRHSPGALTDLRSALVNNTIFATLAARHGFHKYFRHMSPGLNEVLTKYVKIQEENGHSISEEHYLIQEDEMEQAEDVEVPKALGDLFESVAGAIFLDSGMSLGAVWKSVGGLLGAELDAFSAAAPKSPVRELLEAEPDTAKFGKPERLADGRRVRVCVEVFGRGAFKGIGRNYRIAKGTAARCALRHLRSCKPK